MKMNRFFTLFILISVIFSSCGDSGNTKKYEEELMGTNVQPPSTPTNVSITVVSGSQIDLSWAASTDAGGITEYKIYRGGSYLKTVTSTSASDTGLTDATNYCYQVTAIDSANNESAKSAQVCGTTQDTTSPFQPTNLTATIISGAQINLSWTAPTDNVGITGYKLYRGGSFLKDVTNTSTSDTGLTNATQYCYQVAAVDAALNESTKSVKSVRLRSIRLTPHHNQRICS